MLKSISSLIGKCTEYAREKKRARRKANAVRRMRAYLDFQEANPPAVRKLYGENLTPEAPLEHLDVTALEAMLAQIPAVYPKPAVDRRETILKQQVGLLHGVREIKYADNGRTTFHYYTENALMNDQERTLATYAEIARMYDFLDDVMLRQFLWVCIKRTVSEVTSEFDLRRIRNTANYYPDTRELCVVFEFGRDIKSFDHAWRVLTYMLKKKGENGPRKAIAERLTAEVTTAGWDR